MALDFDANLNGNDHIFHDTHVVQWGKLKIVEIAKSLKETLRYMDAMSKKGPEDRVMVMLRPLPRQEVQK